MSRTAPLIEEQSAGYLDRVVNRAGSSFDVAALSTEEVILIYMLLDRLIDALWRHHQHVLLPLYQSLLERLGLLETDEPEDAGDSH